jgi:hypothetical protein
VNLNSVTSAENKVWLKRRRKGRRKKEASCTCLIKHHAMKKYGGVEV